MGLLTSATFSDRELATAAKWYQRVFKPVSDALVALLGTDIGWKTPVLTAGWTNYGPDQAPAGYRLLDDVLTLRGLVAGGAIPSNPLFTLPVGYRPPAGQIFLGVATTGFVRIDILATGAVNIVSAGSGGANNYVSLGEVRMLVD